MSAGAKDEARSGTDLGGYRIESLLGAGGMGVVYRAVERASGKVVALKLLRMALAENADRRRRFVREARLAATLDHPGIVRTHEVGDADGDAFIAMELVSGKNLKAWIAEERDARDHADVARVVGVARGIVNAVKYAHEKGIVHRDLKPDNVMVADDGSVRVLDFGLAKLREIEGGALYEAETQTSLTQDGHVLGTPGYMAPEQAAGREVGFPADVFAVGAMMYEMLTGERAFAGDSPIDVIVAVTRDTPPRPRAKNPDVGEALDALVMKCLEKAPAQRPTMERLEAALARPAVLERGAPAVSEERRPQRRRLAPAIGALAVLGLGVIAFAETRHPTAAPPVLADAAVVDAGPVPTAATDLPLPPSDVPQALATYKKAIAEEREGAEDAAGVDLEAATKLDPTLAAAHLRAALFLSTTEAQSARSHFALAVKYRDRLSPRDRELLEAAQLLLQSDPPDNKGWLARLESVVAHYPGDAELLYHLAIARDGLGEFAGAEATTQRALELDPKFGLAWATVAEVQAYRGEFDESLASVARCLEVTPAASWCIWVREFIDGDEGRCANNEADARRRIVIDPNIHDGYKALSYSLMALGKPDALVREAIDQTVLRIDSDFGKKRFNLNMSIRLAETHGDFGTAAKLAADLRALVSPRSDAADHSAAALMSAEIEREAGRPERAAEFVRSFLDRHEAWQNDAIVHDYSMASDLTPLLLTFVNDPKYLPTADREAALAAWRQRNDKGAYGDYRPYVWVYGYAAPTVTADQARSALEALPRYSPIPPFLPDGALPDASVGRTLWLGGREDEGIAYLQKAARSCAMGTRPVPTIMAGAWLAEALEKKGDTAGACRELQAVLSHWGNAKPRSVTGEWAKSRSRALRCENGP